MVVLGLDCSNAASGLIDDISISSIGDSSVVDKVVFAVTNSDVGSIPTSGTVCRRRRGFAGASGGSRAAFCAGTAGEGPALEIGEKKGEVGLLKSVNDEAIVMSE